MLDSRPFFLFACRGAVLDSGLFWKFGSRGAELNSVPSIPFCLPRSSAPLGASSSNLPTEERRSTRGPFGNFVSRGAELNSVPSISFCLPRSSARLGACSFYFACRGAVLDPGCLFISPAEEQCSTHARLIYLLLRWRVMRA